MDISVTVFKQRCLWILRRVERTGERVTLTRRGRAVAEVGPWRVAARPAAATPWEQLRALGGRLRAAPGESVVRDDEFEALR